MAVWWLFNFAVCCCVRLYAVVSNCFNVSYCFYYIRVIVIAYVMWISAKFHLIVLRAFLAMHRNQPQQPALPMVTDDFKQAIIKILNYASQYEVFQRAICTKRGEAQQRQMEFFFSEIAGEESYLFVFKPNIAQDIQHASDLLHKLITQ